MRLIITLPSPRESLIGQLQRRDENSESWYLITVHSRDDV